MLRLSTLSLTSRFLVALVLLVLAPLAAQACQPAPPSARLQDPPVTLYADGSFIGASVGNWDAMEGRPVRDIGGGRVGQVIQYSGCEGVAQSLLFVDCTTGAAILVAGQGGPIAEADGVLLSTRAIQAPHGPLALSPATTVAEIAAIAAREGLTVRIDVPAWAAERGERNAFNPFMGCRIVYPGSVGAGR